MDPTDATQSEWPDPEPLTEPLDLLPYPVDALPPMLRDAVREAQAFVQAPMALVACSALAVLSVASQGLWRWEYVIPPKADALARAP